MSNEEDLRRIICTMKKLQFITREKDANSGIRNKEIKFGKMKTHGAG